METNGITQAEKMLSIVATTVLVLGAIGTIATFFSSCILWDVSSYSGLEMEGINWLGFPVLIYVIMATLIGWSVLSVIAEMAANIRLSKNNAQDWKKEFAVLISTDQKGKAKELLYREIFQSAVFKNLHKGDSELTFSNGVNEAYKEQQRQEKEQQKAAFTKELHVIYGSYLKAIGEESFKYDSSNGLFEVFV